MNLDDYQFAAARTAPTPGHQHLVMPALGLAGEAGEVVDLVKKHYFHGHPLDRAALAKELGDVLWYLAVLADCAGLSLEHIAEVNLTKLAARYPDGFSAEASINRAAGDV